MDTRALEASSTLAWIYFNKFVTEKKQPFEFVKHRFLIDYIADEHEDICCPKCSQIGATLIETFDDFHQAGEKGLNVIHTLQNSDVIKGFVVPKVDPIIAFNPKINAMLRSDSQNLKQFNDGYVFFRGANSTSQAINISADILKIDEIDRSDQDVVSTFTSRTDYSEAPRIKRFSNPSSVGFGVDALWQDSNQFHWFIECHHCNHEWFIDFWRKDGEQNHYVDIARAIYACGKCDRELSDDDRIFGRWVEKYPTRKHRHGYWFSQMMSPWFSAARIINKYETLPLDVFYNFTLGKAYTPQDMNVDRAAVLRACAPSHIQRNFVSIGVDQDAGGQYYVCMTPQGIFEHGYVDSWDKIEHLKLMYKAIVVCDPNPYSTVPKQLASKYSDWYLCYFKQMDGLSSVQWKEAEKVVYADRTRVIDIRANEIVNARMLYRERPYELEDIIAHWNNLYRTTEEKEDGKVRSIWVKKDDKQSDYPFAEVYARIGLSQLLGGESALVEGTPGGQEARTTNLTAAGGNAVTVDLRSVVADTFAEMDS